MKDKNYIVLSVTQNFLRKATFGDTSNLYMKGINYNVNFVTTGQLRNALFSYM